MRLVAVAAIFLLPSLAAADGGAIRLSQERRNYRITVFTAPTPVRAGPVDISVLVQDVATGQPAAAVQVTIKAQRADSVAAANEQRATTEAATNKLYHAAAFDLPEAGWYAVEVTIDGALGEARVRFDVEVGEPAPPWLTMLPWAGWPLAVILLFGIHQVLARRRRGP